MACAVPHRAGVTHQHTAGIGCLRPLTNCKACQTAANVAITVAIPGRGADMLLAAWAQARCKTVPRTRACLASQRCRFMPAVGFSISICAASVRKLQSIHCLVQIETQVMTVLAETQGLGWRAPVTLCAVTASSRPRFALQKQQLRPVRPGTTPNNSPHKRDSVIGASCSKTHKVKARRRTALTRREASSSR
jgi:hypothetical protein